MWYEQPILRDLFWFWALPMQFKRWSERDTMRHYQCFNPGDITWTVLATNDPPKNLIHNRPECIIKLRLQGFDVIQKMTVPKSVVDGTCAVCQRPLVEEP